jgi:predicted transcriptional regulator
MEIILQIFESANVEILPSNLLTKANLNTARMQRYTELLLEEELLIRKTVECGKNRNNEVFVTSREEMECIAVLKDLEEATRELDRRSKK